MISLEYAPRDLQGGASLKRTILFSVLIHVVALSILFFSPSLPSRQWTFGPVYSVDLVSPSAVLSEKGGSSPSKDILARTLRESFKEDTIVLKKTVKTTPPSPLKKHSETEKEDKGRVDKAIDDIRKRLATSEKKGAAGPAGPAGPAGQGRPTPGSCPTTPRYGPASRASGHCRRASCRTRTSKPSST